MIRLLQVSTQNLALKTFAGRNRSVLVTRPIGTSQARAFSVSSVLCKHRGASNANDSDHYGIKKSFIDMANDTLENVGLKKRPDGDERARRSNDHDDSRYSTTDESDCDEDHRRRHGRSRKKSRLRSVVDREDDDHHRQRSTRLAGRQPSPGRVYNDKKRRQFVLELGGGQVARIDYETTGKGRIEMHHTEVPIELRGLGIGKILAKGAFDCAERENLRVKVTCSYLEDYLERFAGETHKQLID